MFIDWGSVLFLGTYAMVGTVMLLSSIHKIYKFIKRRRRPKLTLIQGGKQDKGPYGR